MLPDRRRAGERDLGDARVGDERLSEHGALAGEHLEDALRQPASRMISAIRSVVSGVVSAGFATSVLPQTSAGPSLFPSSVVGKFHGTIATTTPSGRLTTSPCVFDVEARDVCAAQALRQPCVVLERVDEARDLDPRLAQRLALLERQLQRELVPLREHRLGAGAHDRAAPRRRRLPPARETPHARGRRPRPPRRARLRDASRPPRPRRGCG